MDQKQLVNTLKKKFINSKENIRVFVNGDWGIGKTEAWKFFVNENSQMSQGRLKIIYLSLFGLDSIEMINKKIKVEYIGAKDEKTKGFMDSKIAQLVTQVGGMASKKYLGGTVDLLSVYTPEFGEDYLVCFDDLERKSDKIKMNDIMGVIEEIGLKSKVLVIANEDRIVGSEKEIFKLQKEKLLDYEFHLNELSMDTVTHVIANKSKLGLEEKDTLGHFFYRYGKANLRTLKKIINFTNEVYDQVKLNSDLVKLCAAILIEDFTPDKTNHDGNNEPSYVSLLKYGKYNLGYSAHDISEDIKKYLKGGELNKEKIENFLNPQKDQVIVWLNNMYSVYLKSEVALRQTIDSILHEFDNGSAQVFKSVRNVLALVALLKYYNYKFNLGYNIGNLDNKAKVVITSLAKDNPSQILESMGLLGIPPECFKFVDQLIDDTKAIIELEKNKEISEVFEKAFHSSEYRKCFELLMRNPKLITNTLYVFELIPTDCESDYYAHVLEFTEMLKNRKMKHEIKVARRFLLDLSKGVTDVVVLDRLRIVINKIRRVN